MPLLDWKEFKMTMHSLAQWLASLPGSTAHAVYERMTLAIYPRAAPYCPRGARGLGTWCRTSLSVLARPFRSMALPAPSRRRTLHGSPQRHWPTGPACSRLSTSGCGLLLKGPWDTLR